MQELTGIFLASAMDIPAGVQGFLNKAFEEEILETNNMTSKRKTSKENIKQTDVMFDNMDSCEDFHNIRVINISIAEDAITAEVDSIQFETEDAANSIYLESDNISTANKVKSNQVEKNDKTVIFVKDKTENISKAAVYDSQEVDKIEVDESNSNVNVVCNKCLENSDSDASIKVKQSEVKLHSNNRDNLNLVNNRQTLEAKGKMPVKNEASGKFCQISSSVLKYIEEDPEESREEFDEAPNILRFAGSFLSFREKKVKQSWRRRSLGEEVESFCKLIGCLSVEMKQQLKKNK